MEISTKQYKHCDVVSIKGRVDSATAPQLAEALNALMEQGRFKIILDMSGTEYMSSAGFRTILAAHKNCKRYNRGEVVLALVPPAIYEAFELTGMTSLFRFFDDVTEAVGSF